MFFVCRVSIIKFPHVTLCIIKNIEVLGAKFNQNRLSRSSFETDTREENMFATNWVEPLFLIRIFDFKNIPPWYSINLYL